MQATGSNIRFPPIIAVSTVRVDVRFGEAAMIGSTVLMGASATHEAQERRPFSLQKLILPLPFNQCTDSLSGLLCPPYVAGESGNQSSDF